MKNVIGNIEAIEMMQRCKDEISAMRAHISRIETKAHAYETLCSILSLLPKQSESRVIDLEYILQKRIEELRSVPVE